MSMRMEFKYGLSGDVFIRKINTSIFRREIEMRKYIFYVFYEG